MGFVVNSFRFGAPPITSLSLIASTTSNLSDSCTAPASGIVAGDLLVFCDMVYSTTVNPSLATPSGFTNKADFLPDTSPGVRRFAFSTKIADGSENGVSYTGMSPAGTGTQRMRGKAILQFRADRAIVAVGSGLGAGSVVPNSSARSKVITTGTGPAPLLLIGWESSNNAAVLDITVSASSVKDGIVTNSSASTDANPVKNQVAWKAYISGNVDATVECTNSGQSCVGGFYVHLD